MANTLRIKRRPAAGGAGAPSSLKNAELAFNESTNILYYGSGDDGFGNATSIITIAGSGSYVDLSTNQSIGGVKTFTGTIAASGATAVSVPTVATATNDTNAASTAFVRSAITAYAVTSVGLSLPSIFTVSNSPVITTGTLTATLTTQAANSVFAGPTSGSDAAPTFRSLVANDIPTLTASKISDFDTQVRTNRLDQMAAPTNPVSFNAQLITNVADPLSAQDAATKSYVDTVAQGLDVHASVMWATAAALPAYNYYNGVSGVGATITGANDGALSIDSNLVAVTDRVLVKNETSTNAPYNGIYVVSDTGSPTTPYILTRAADMNQPAEFPGSFVFVEQGSSNADTGWVCTTDSPITVGTTNITWTQFSGAGAYEAGAGLYATGTTFNVGTASSSRIVVNADNIDLATVSRSDTTGTAGLSFLQSLTTDSYGRVTASVTADVRTGSTSQTGVLQLTDSTSSTSTTTAATPNSVKSAYDLANAALPKSGGTMTGTINLLASTTSLVPLNFAQGTVDPSAPVDGDLWVNGDLFKYFNGSSTKTFAFTDSNITGTAANVTGVVAAVNGGTGLSSYTAGDLIYAASSSTLTTLADVATGSALISGGVGAAPSWGKIGLTTHVSGILALANGGTGSNLSAAASGTIFKTNGTNFVAAVAGTDYLNDASTIDGGTF